ncbi:MAG: LysM peptidoglycan-binding domain-containing protein [Kofleriaceae bacterium]
MPPVTMLTFEAEGLPSFVVPYNPSELSFEKTMKFAEIAIPGLDAPLQQFVRGEAEKLTLELLFDSTETGTGLGATSVTEQSDKAFSLARINPSTHAPPVVTVGWNHHFPGDSLVGPLGAQRRNTFVGVVESIRQKFTLFSPEGIPLRATVNLTLREYRKLDAQLSELNLMSPDRTHSHTIRGGETLSAIAGKQWNRPGDWRNIADENEVEDPRRLRVGTFLRVPVLDTRRPR